MAPNVDYMNPASVAKYEVWNAFGHHDIACLISIGNGKVPPTELSGHSWTDKARAVWQFITTGNPDQIDALRQLVMYCEHIHEELKRDSSLYRKYFRFNLEAEEGTRRNMEWSQENKELVLQKVGKTKLEASLAAQSDALESQSYLEEPNTQRAIANAVALL